jgi:hypothetical protein
MFSTLAKTGRSESGLTFTMLNRRSGERVIVTCEDIVPAEWIDQILIRIACPFLY